MNSTTTNETVKGMRTHEQKRDYLIGKMYDGAVALYDFFETLKEKKNVDISRLSKKLKTQYDLTPNQQEFLDHTATRAKKARAVVQHLEDKFGVNEDGTIKDAQGLHTLLFGREAPKNTQARSYNFGIGITYGHWAGSDVDGRMGVRYSVGGEGRCVLEDNLKDTLSRIDQGEDAGCMNLSFKMPIESRVGKFSNKINAPNPNACGMEILLRELFNTKTNSKEVGKAITSHELRHIIDYVMGVEDQFFRETAAHLYSGFRPSHGIRRDYTQATKEWTERAKKREDALARLNEYQAPVGMIKRSEKLLAEAKNELADLDKNRLESYKAYAILIRSPLPCSAHSGKPRGAVMSYLFSTMPRRKIFKRVKTDESLLPKGNAELKTRRGKIK